MSEELDDDLDHQYNHKPKTIAQLINTLPDVGTMPYEFRLQLKEVLYSLLDQKEKLGLSRDSTINGTFGITRINERYDEDIKKLKSQLDN